jgi:hypothetical protein
MLSRYRFVAPILAGLVVRAGGSHYCDSALHGECGDVRGDGAVCTRCLGGHQYLLHLAGCSSTDLAEYCVAGINPRYRANITVYHVHPATAVVDLADKNTGDLAGIVFFDLR